MDGSNDSVDSEDLKHLKDNVLSEALRNFKFKFNQSTQSLVSNTNHSYEGENKKSFHGGGHIHHHQYRNASQDTSDNNNKSSMMENHSRSNSQEPASSSIHSSSQFKKSSSGNFYSLPVQKLHHQRSSLVEPRNRHGPGGTQASFSSTGTEEEEDGALSWIGKSKRDVVGGGGFQSTSINYNNYNNTSKSRDHHRLSLPAVKASVHFRKPSNRIFPMDDTASSDAPTQRSSAVSDASSVAFPEYNRSRQNSNDAQNSSYGYVRKQRGEI